MKEFSRRLDRFMAVTQYAKFVCVKNAEKLLLEITESFIDRGYKK